MAISKYSRMHPLFQALNQHFPNSRWTINGDETYENLEWAEDNDDLKPTKEFIEEKVAEIQAGLDATEYQVKRSPNYPPLEDLADALYWQAQGDNTKMDEYLAAVQAVKEQFPKP